MAGKKNELGATGRTVAANLKRIREGRGMSYAELSRVLESLGRQIPPLGLRRIEAGERRIDVDDLVAVAIALEVTPSVLMTPRAETSSEATEVTGVPEGSISVGDLWDYLRGLRPVGPARNSRLDSLDFVLRCLPEHETPYRPNALRRSDDDLLKVSIQLETDGTNIDRAVGIGETSIFGDEDD